MSSGTAPHAQAISSSSNGGRFGHLNLRQYAPVKAWPMVSEKGGLHVARNVVFVYLAHVFDAC